MKHTLKTLLVTTLLAAPTTFGANALPTDTGVTHDMANVTSSNVNMKYEILNKLHSLYDGKRDRLEPSTDEAILMLQELTQHLEILTPDIKSHDIPSLVNLAFQEVFNTTIKFPHVKDSINLLSDFSSVIATFNIPQFKSLAELTPDELLSRANSGDEAAQKHIVKELVDAKNLKALSQYAEHGWSVAQTYVAEGYATGKYGFVQNKEQLLKLAHDMRGSIAQNLVAEGYGYGWYGFAKDSYKVLVLASLGWSWAQNLAAERYASGQHGFTKNIQELIALAHKGGARAQELVADGYATGAYGISKNMAELLKLAHDKGWSRAREYVACGYAEGKFGFTQDKDKLEALAIAGWAAAQALVTDGYSAGAYGFTRNTKQLLKLSYDGWLSAQKRITLCFAFGMLGFPKDPTLARLFEVFFDLKNKQKI
jgi:hypothetical protein